MTKPTIDDTRFGETGGGTPAGTLSAPASGRKDTGYTSGVVPPPGEHSWLWNKAHQWFKLLDSWLDGSTPSNVTLPGNLTVTGTIHKTWVRRFYPKVIAAGGWSQSSAVGSGGITIQTQQSAIGTIIIEIPFEPGDRLVGLTYQAFGNGTTDVSPTVFYAATANTAGGSRLSLGTVNDVNRAAGAFGDVAITPFTAQVLADGSYPQLEILANGTGYHIGMISAAFDR